MHGDRKRKKGPDIVRAHVDGGPGSLTLSLESRMNAQFLEFGRLKLPGKLPGEAAPLVQANLLQR